MIGGFLFLVIDILIIYRYNLTKLKKSMNKINVLVLPSDTSGVGKFRSVDPHVKLQNLYPDEFHVDIDYQPNINDLNYWKKYQIVHFHRSIGTDYDNSPKIIEMLKSMGIVVIGDIDDYWLPTKEHPIHQLIIQNKLQEKIIANLKVSDYVITTTEIFANEIRKFNKNVIVLPNAVDPQDPQFNEPTLPSDKVRIGWLGGSSHLHDLKLLDGMVTKLSSMQEKLQYYVCGFDIRGTVTEINQQTGQKTQRSIKPEETVWVKYEQIFTDNYKIITPKYKDYLDTFTENDYPSVLDENYVRVWTRPVTSYAKNYSKFDISLAPIKNHIFNRMKSQLKVIEAGFYKKALIASNVGPYTIDLKHALKNGEFTDGNALLVNENNNHSDWAKNIKKLVENPNMITDLGERLYETVKDKYDLNNVTHERASFYKSLIK
jgi:glycosyltransferase involved in cell wall biosynthesis